MLEMNFNDQVYILVKYNMVSFILHQNINNLVKKIHENVLEWILYYKEYGSFDYYYFS